LSAVLATERALSLIEQEQPNLSLLWLARALETAPADDADLQRLIRTNLGALLGRRPPQFRPPDVDPSRVKAHSPDRRTLPPVIRKKDGFRPDDLKKYFFSLAEDGDQLALQLFDLSSHKPLGEPIPLQGQFSGATFSPDGKTLSVTTTVGVGPSVSVETQV